MSIVLTLGSPPGGLYLGVRHHPWPTHRNGGWRLPWLALVEFLRVRATCVGAVKHTTGQAVAWLCSRLASRRPPCQRDQAGHARMATLSTSCTRSPPQHARCDAFTRPPSHTPRRCFHYLILPLCRAVRRDISRGPLTWCAKVEIELRKAAEGSMRCAVRVGPS